MVYYFNKIVTNAISDEMAAVIYRENIDIDSKKTPIVAQVPQYRFVLLRKVQKMLLDSNAGTIQ